MRGTAGISCSGDPLYRWPRRHHQFLDCGAGLPTAENTHQVAQRLQPDAHVVYIDNEPIVLAHGWALLEENDQTHFGAADIFKQHEVLGNEVVRKYLAFSQPIALFQLSTLHHYDGSRARKDHDRIH